MFIHLKTKIIEKGLIVIVKFNKSNVTQKVFWKTLIRLL